LSRKNGRKPSTSGDNNRKDIAVRDVRTFSGADSQSLFTSAVPRKSRNTRMTGRKWIFRVAGRSKAASSGNERQITVQRFNKAKGVWKGA
jgi:hypothetical protein